MEGDGVMAGTPEVAAKLQQMYPEPDAGFQYDFSREIAETFVEDAKLGPAPSYHQATASTVYELNKLWKRYMDAARRAGKMRASGGTGWMNEHVTEALRHSKKILPLLMEQIENDYMCSELRKFFCECQGDDSKQAGQAGPDGPGKRLQTDWLGRADAQDSPKPDGKGDHHARQFLSWTIYHD